jgi:hypothetical protein
VKLFLAPAEPEFPVTSRPIAPQPVQKHYRIIFIKAPSPPVATISSFSTPQREEKTIVYVLVKKPDEVPEVVQPIPSSTVPSKPEVYFIRYKTQENDGTTAEPEIVTEGGPYGY